MSSINGVVELESKKYGKIGFHFGMWSLITYCKKEEITFDQFSKHLSVKDTVKVVERLVNLLVLANSSYIKFEGKDFEPLDDFGIYYIIDELGTEKMVAVISEGVSGMSMTATADTTKKN